MAWLESLIADEFRALDGSVEPFAPAQRIALFSEAFLPKVDGVTRTALLTIRHLRQTGREVLVFAPAPAVACIEDVPVIGVPSLPLPDYPDTRVALPDVRVWRRLRVFAPDLIHLFSPFALGALGMLAGGNLRVPVVANYQTDLPAYTRRYGFGYLRRAFIGALRFLHNGCTLNLAPTQLALDQLRAWGFRRLRLWGRGVDCARFRPDRRSAIWRERLLAGRAPDSLIALYVGRLAKEKHLETLATLSHEPGVALTLVGDGIHRTEAESRLGGNARFMGALTGEALADAFAAADVFVFPGANETFGQAVLEALASGLPAVVTDQGGPATLIQEGASGFICPVGDGDAFAERVRQLRSNPVLRAQMAVHARAEAEKRPWGAVMTALEAHYAEALRLHARWRAW